MIPPSDRQTDRQTDGRAIAYSRLSIYVFHVLKMLLYVCYELSINACQMQTFIACINFFIIVVTNFNSHYKVLKN